MKESKWSNGEEVTANDFVYSWNRVVADETAADYSYLFDVVDRNADGSLAVEATDDYTLTVKLVAPCAYFIDLTAFPTFYPVYQAGVEEANPDGTNPGAWAQEAGFVSNGAYTLQTWNHNESMIYVKIAESIQADLSILGIEVTIKQEDWNVFLADRKSGNYSGMCREGWLADYNDPINMLEIFTSDSGNNDMQLGK